MERHSFRIVSGETRNFHTRKLGEITLFHAVFCAAHTVINLKYIIATPFTVSCYSLENYVVNTALFLTHLADEKLYYGFAEK